MLKQYIIHLMDIPILLSRCIIYNCVLLNTVEVVVLINFKTFINLLHFI